MTFMKSLMGATAAFALSAGAALAEILHDRIRDRFFAVDGGDEAEEDAEAEAQRIEAMRAELMDELRVALREELNTLKAQSPQSSFPDDADAAGADITETDGPEADAPAPLRGRAGK